MGHLIRAGGVEPTEILADDTVSLGKSSGSKGKQYYRRTALKTQTHSQGSHKIKEKLCNIPQIADTKHKFQPDHKWPMST